MPVISQDIRNNNVKQEQTKTLSSALGINEQDGVLQEKAQEPNKKDNLLHSYMNISSDNSGSFKLEAKTLTNQDNTTCNGDDLEIQVLSHTYQNNICDNGTQKLQTQPSHGGNGGNLEIQVQTPTRQNDICDNNKRQELQAKTPTHNNCGELKVIDHSKTIRKGATFNSRGPAAIMSTGQESIEAKNNLLAVKMHLVCTECKHWLRRGKVNKCHCSLACDECIPDPPTCSNCKQNFTNDVGFNCFYDRITSEIYHPCPHASCNTLVKPKDQHESICEFKPFTCAMCNHHCEITSNTAWSHFSEVHKYKVPLHEGENDNIRYSQFWENHSGKKLIYCFIQDQFLEIKFDKVEEGQTNAQIIISKEVDDEDTNYIVKLNFIKNGWSCARTNKKKTPLTSLIEVPLHIVKEWQANECTLDISVKAKKAK